MVSNIIFTIIMLILTVIVSAYCGIKDAEDEKSVKKADTLK